MAVLYGAGERLMNEPLFTDTVTLYNHYRDVPARTDHWQRTVLKGVQYREKVETAITDTGLKMAASVGITIPVNVDAGGRHYLPWEAFVTTQNRERYWTLNPAGNQDVVVLGDCPAEITEAYTLGSLKKEYGSVTVQAVRDNTLRRGLKHWKAGCV